MDIERRIEELLESISNNDKYNSCVFEAPGIYFVIGNGSLWEIPDSSNGTPKGGVPLEIFRGPTAAQNNFIEDLMNKLDFDEEFFNDYLCDCIDFNDEGILEYLEDDEDALSIYKKMKRKVKSSGSPFADIEEFIIALGRYGLDNSLLYYEWDGDFIELYDNICDTGEGRGHYDNLSDSNWIEILENIDSYILHV